VIRFWQTTAVVSAIIATTGEVDIGTLPPAALIVYSLVRVYRYEKHSEALK
jgi:hypothetical protein